METKQLKYASKTLKLMDINLPIMDGFTAAKKIKEFLPNIPIIGQTTFSLEDDQIKFNDNGFDEYITKPIKEEELFETLNKFNI